MPDTSFPGGADTFATAAEITDVVLGSAGTGPRDHKNEHELLGKAVTALENYMLTHLRSATVHLTGAQLATFQSAQPFTLVAAPGAGKMLVPRYALLEFVYANSIYSSPGFLEVKWPNATQLPGKQTFGLRFTDFSWSATFASTLNHASPNLDNIQVNQPSFDRAWAANQPLILASQPADPQVWQGTITASGVTAGGNNYAVGDTGDIPCTDFLGNAGNPATYVVTTVSSGHVTGFTLTNHDPGYAVGPGLPTETSGAQPGTGTGFTVNATAINPPDGDLYVTVVYSEYTVH